MRLLLDEHLSPRRIGAPLRERGHDVLAAGESGSFERWPDEQLLALAARERRIIVTCDVKDFPPLTRRWAEAQRDHAGCIVLVGMGHSEFGAILRAVDTALSQSPDPAAWRNRLRFVSRLSSP